MGAGSVDGVLCGDWHIKTLPFEGSFAFFLSLNPVAAL